MSEASDKIDRAYSFDDPIGTGEDGYCDICGHQMCNGKCLCDDCWED